MNRYRDTLAFLYGLQHRGMKFGLRNIRALLRAAGNPERLFPSIHVAGTNGKGSTSSLIASAYAESGLRTGLYTSPHLVRFTERIRVNGKEIPEARLVEYIRILRPQIEKEKATFFEATTCAAFLYFADEGVDIAVIEAGLGGRLDSTNVLRPLVSVITNVGLEHTGELGNTLRKIAREKAGIIKRGVPVVTASMSPVVVDVLRRTASRKGSPFFHVLNMVQFTRPVGGEGYGLRGKGIRVPMVTPGLRGRHQELNAALAFAAILLTRRGTGTRYGPGLPSRNDIARGFARVTRNTGLQGRFQYVKKAGRVIIDVAHNPDGMSVLAATISDERSAPAVAVLGVMKDKDYHEMLRRLAGVCPTIVAVAPWLERSLSARDLYLAGKKMGIPMVYGGTVARGLRLARKLAGKGTILLTGSHYVAGEGLKALVGENA